MASGGGVFLGVQSAALMKDLIISVIYVRAALSAGLISRVQHRVVMFLARAKYVRVTAREGSAMVTKSRSVGAWRGLRAC